MRAKIAEEIMQKVVADYSNISEDFHKTRKADWKEFHIFLDFIKDGQYIGDLGCGNGRFYHFISKHRKVHYIGIDNNEKLLTKARENFGKKLFILGDLTKMPLKANTIDVACAIASFHHIPSTPLRKQALSEIYRILKPNGTLIISVWNLFQPKYKKYIWQARLRWLLSFGKYESRDTFIPWGDSGVKRYYHAFTPKELRKLLQNSNFKITSEHISRNIIFTCKKS